MTFQGTRKEQVDACVTSLFLSEYEKRERPNLLESLQQEKHLCWVIKSVSKHAGLQRSAPRLRVTHYVKSGSSSFERTLQRAVPRRPPGTAVQSIVRAQLFFDFNRDVFTYKAWDIKRQRRAAMTGPFEVEMPERPPRP